MGLLLLGLYDSSYLLTDFEGLFAGWAKLHLALVMLFGAWFGARAIAPEREGQTLIQLLTIPLKPIQIIQGKMGAVLTFTFYVWIVAAPLAILLGMLSLIPWATAGRFIVVEMVLGALSAAWGLYCSFHAGTVRRALSTALGGATALLLSHGLVFPLFDVFEAFKLWSGRDGAAAIYSVLPLPLLIPEKTNQISYYLSSGASATAPLYSFLVVPALLFYTTLAFLLLAMTARDFKKYSQTA